MTPCGPNLKHTEEPPEGGVRWLQGALYSLYVQLVNTTWTNVCGQLNLSRTIRPLYLHLDCL